MHKSTTSFLLALLISIPFAFSQNVKFGKVFKEELEEKFYPLDSSANAAILYKKRRTYFDYSQSEGWALITKVHERIKIYNKNGNDWATKKISLYKGNDEERVSIKAYTFNLVNNKVEKTKLKSNEIFVENINKYWDRKKFTMPNLTEGGIVEWQYTIRSPYYSNIDDMVFQYKIPVKYIDTEVITPEFFVFKNQSKGYFPINLKRSTKSSNIILNTKSRSGNSGFNTTKTTFSQDKVDYISSVVSCIQKNIPAIIEEPYVNNINNYITSLEFEISAYKPKYATHKYYNTTWNDVTKTIYKSSNFGEQLKKTSYFKDDLQNLVEASTPENEKIIKIFQFVKSKIKWNEYRNKYTRDGVKKAYKDGVGNSAEINLILVAMLREIGVKANPILVSTRNHGIPIFPTSEGFNYVIAGAETKSGLVLLDATEKYSLPNVLPLRDLNWQGRIVRKDGSSTSVNLIPKKHSKQNTFVNAKIDSDGFLTGQTRTIYDNLNALNYRNAYINLSEEDLNSKLESKNNNIEIRELKINNKKDISKPIIEMFKLETEDEVEIIGNKMYISPMLFLTEKENPFKSEKREFPVDFGVPWEDKATIFIQIPDSYTVESLPGKIAIGLPENLGVFRFLTSLKDNKIQIVCSTKINTPIVPSEHYNALKYFYKQMIEKQTEKIVLTKI